MTGYRANWFVFWFYRAQSKFLHELNPLCRCRFKVR